MCIDSTIQQIEGMRTHFETYRNKGFDVALKTAKDIASGLGVEQSFRVRRHTSRKKQLTFLDGLESILLGLLFSF
jgi:hypothetical protein